MNLAGYIRVSTGGQIDGFGPEVQRDLIVKWAGANEHTVTHWVEDLGVSGTVDGEDRDGIGELLVLADDKVIDGVIAFDVSRFARDLIVQETLLSMLWSKGLTVFTCSGGEVADNDADPTRIMVRQILAVFAQFERSMIVARMRGGRQAKLRHGGYGGGVTRYGLRASGQGRDATLVPDEAEQQVVETVRSLRSQGHSMRAIAAHLNSARIPTKRGKDWAAAQVSRLLTN